MPESLPRGRRHASEFWRVPPQQIEQERARRRERADAYRDQEMSRLFVECDWSQERIARKMGKSREWVDKRLRFGRFVAWLGTACTKNEKPPENLTEGRFRTLWSKTEGKDETQRFRQVQAMLDRDGLPATCGRATTG